MKKHILILMLLLSLTIPVNSAEMELIDEGILVHGNCFECICNPDDYSMEIMDTGYPALFQTEDGINYTFAILAAEDQMIDDLQEYSIKKAEDYFGVRFSEEDILDILPESLKSFDTWAGIRTNIWYSMSSDQVISASVYALTDFAHTLVFMYSREGDKEKIKEAGKRKNVSYFKDLTLLPTVEDSDQFSRSAESDQLGQYAYEKGDTFYTKKDFEKALEWYLLAAKMELTSAYDNIGWMYLNGYGVDKDYSEAVKWFKKAAKQGNVSAQYHLGFMYQNGYGVEKDYSEAVKWYREAAEEGLAGGQYSLGFMYRYGYGVEKDYSEAVRWYIKAAEQGNVSAQNSLGDMYYYGYEIDQDYAEAIKWYRKAAEQGNTYAQHNLEILSRIAAE